MSVQKYDQQNNPTLSNDPDAWASAILTVGSLAWKGVAWWEHVDFLLSLREEKFKVMFEFWESTGWWAASLIGVIWFVDRLRKRRAGVAPSTPTWSLVGACSFVAFAFGSLLAVQSVGGVPMS